MKSFKAILKIRSLCTSNKLKTFANYVNTFLKNFTY